MSRIAKVVAVTAAAGAVLAGGAGMAAADAVAEGAAIGSPGVLSGNVLQVPIHIPINICGNTVNVVGALNPAFGNVCVNGGGGSKGGHHKVDQHGE
ncbi:chaplin [Streptomyces sp. NPDC060028]|uniref:chaplin n=1 Tax=Streptomyces sp. NPDC060028 TaxID=3347041 RepID=UPI0036B3E941